MSDRIEPIADDCRELYSRDAGFYTSWYRRYNQGMKDWLSYINEGRPETQGVTIPVVYATPERAFADLIRPRVEGQVDIPAISFVLTSLSFNQSRPNGFLSPTMQWDKYKVGDKWRIASKPMPWDIDYNVTIWSKFYETLDLVSYALLSRFIPKSYLYVNGIASEISYQGFSDNSTLEPGADADRVLRHDFQFKVQAWMPMPTYEYGSINQVIMWVTNELNGKNPDGSDKTVDDAIGDITTPLGEVSVITDMKIEEPSNSPYQTPQVKTMEFDNGEGSTSSQNSPQVIITEQQ